jgi:hypothetical protein
MSIFVNTYSDLDSSYITYNDINSFNPEFIDISIIYEIEFMLNKIRLFTIGTLILL